MPTPPRAMAAAIAATIACAHPARAQAPSPGSIWTIQGENDKASTTPGGSDKYYTSGLRLGWTSGAGAVPQAAADLAQTVWGDGTTRIAIDIAQQIYTPANTDRTHPNPLDHPVGAMLAGTLSVLQDTDSHRSTLALTIGVIGPSALGRQVQNGFHELIGDRINKGWGAQLPDTPAVNLLAERTWRLPLLAAGGLQTDLLPSATAAVGTVRDYVQTGAVLRIGQGLDNDFGVARIRPGVSGADAFGTPDGIPWYIFAGLDGQAIARDAVLDGDLWQRSAHVQHRWFMAEFEAGIAVLWHGARISYTQTWQTASFKGQRGVPFSFGSLTASVRF